MYRVCGHKYGLYNRYSFNYPHLSKEEAVAAYKEKKAICYDIQIFKDKKIISFDDLIRE